MSAASEHTREAGAWGRNWWDFDPAYPNGEAGSAWVEHVDHRGNHDEYRWAHKHGEPHAILLNKNSTISRNTRHTFTIELMRKLVEDHDKMPSPKPPPPSAEEIVRELAASAIIGGGPGGCSLMDKARDWVANNPQETKP